MSTTPKDARAGSGTLTVQVPFTLTKRGGRKAILLPHDMPKPSEPDNTLIKALARAFRWKRMLESGEAATINDLANRERIAPSYLGRLLRLTFLAPDIVEAILEGAQDQSLTAETLRGGIPDDWGKQEAIGRLPLDAGRSGQ